MGRVLSALFVLAATTATAGAEDAQSILAEGAALQEAGEWFKAKKTYERLEKIRGHEGQALYLEALSASFAGSYEEALGLVLLSTAYPGKHDTPARLLYADIVARQGEVDRARELYEQLRPKVDSDTKAIIDNRVAALDKAGKPKAKTRAPAAPRVSTAASAPTAPVTAGVTLYKQAREAFAKGDHARALELAQKSATTPGAHTFDAKLLYGDVLFKQGDYRRAKDIYLALGRLATKPGPQVTAILRKVEAANRALQLPEDDDVPLAWQLE